MKQSNSDQTNPTTMSRISRRKAMKLTLGSILAAGTISTNLLGAGTGEPRLPDARWNRLPQWHGFNLLEMFMNPWNNKPFLEDDFRMIHDFGFDFVRLPMDYRNWILDKDWRKFDESALKRIDQAVDFGRRFGVHVCINFHRAPGYTVAKPQEEKLVWDSDEALDVCAMHWRTFAQRFKGVPSNLVSFNLFNEPASVPLDKYMKVHRRLVDEIRAVDPDRLIICDGAQFGREPIMELIPLKVAQATRGYSPMSISHYKASWVGTQNWVEPTWPEYCVSGLLFAPNKQEVKQEYRVPMTLTGPFDKPTTLRLRIAQVSHFADLQVKADSAVVASHQYKPGPGKGEWSEVVHKPQWNTYQNLYDCDFTAEIPAGTKRVEVGLASGDWLVIRQLGLTPQGGAEQTIDLLNNWNEAPAQVNCVLTPNGKYMFTGVKEKGKQWLYDDMIAPWQKLAQSGSGVIVGEFGAFNLTPHDVVLRWLEDSLSNWNQQHWGWAMWNFRGSFGLLDSQRKDVQYEPFHGRQLDRNMLELLQKYSNTQTQK